MSDAAASVDGGPPKPISCFVHAPHTGPLSSGEGMTSMFSVAWKGRGGARTGASGSATPVPGTARPA
jgi:hypothetical protein